MMELDLNELERLAESATQGPWVACGPSFGAALPKYLNEVVVDDPDSEEDGIEICQPPTGLDKESSRDMEFIAAANPAVVLELVRRLREDVQPGSSYTLISQLIAVAIGDIPHDYNGECPDSQTGAGSRDQECPACQILLWAAQKQPPKNED